MLTHGDKSNGLWPFNFSISQKATLPGRHGKMLVLRKVAHVVPGLKVGVFPCQVPKLEVLDDTVPSVPPFEIPIEDIFP